MPTSSNNMAEELQNVLRIRENIASQTLGTTLKDLTDFVVTNNVQGVLPTINQVEETYRLMADYMLRGYVDTQRDTLLQKMKAQLYFVTADIVHRLLIKGNHTFKSLYEETKKSNLDFATLEQRIFDFYQQISLLAIGEASAEDAKSLYQRQFELRRMLFNHLLLMPLLSESDAEQLEQIIVSPMLDTIDRQIIINALTLAQQCNWDARKFRLLCMIFASTDDIAARELALIGIACALPTSADLAFAGELFEETFRQTFQTPESQRQLAELQCQMLICMDTEKNDQTIEREIIPTLKNHAERLTREQFGDLDSIDHIINPHLEDDAMDEMESALNRMRKMKKSGIDVFFGGFSKTKRFPFFYSLVNWFCPFYIEHPSLNANQSDKMQKMNRLIEIQAMCNSDKYSFLLSALSIINHLPESLTKMLADDSLPVPEGLHQATSPMEIRQLLLQDWYRFYFLYPFKADFRNIFADEIQVCFFANSLIASLEISDETIVSIAWQLYKRDRMKALSRFLSVYEPILKHQLAYFHGLIAFKQHDYDRAYNLLADVLSMLIPAPARLLQKAAEAAFLSNRFVEAEALYSQLLVNEDLLKNSDEVRFRVAQCQLRQGNMEEAMPELFRQHFEHADDQRVICAIAQGLLMQDKHEEALRKLGGIETERIADAVLLTSIALFASNRMAEAADELRRFAEITKSDTTDLQSILKEKSIQIPVLKLKQTDLSILIDSVINGGTA